MDLSASVLGESVARKLSERNKAAILSIGRDGLTRSDLARVECFNYVAAFRLSSILNKELKVDSIRDVFNNVNPASLALPGLGTISLAVLGAAFEAKGIGGDSPLVAWLQKHKVKIHTFDTIKHNELENIQAEKRERKRRKQQRRDQAHGKRVERFENQLHAAANGG